jgi:hypothetical protein
MTKRFWILPAALLLAVLVLAGCKKSAEFVEHPQPAFTVDITPFGRAGCDLDPATGIISCLADSPISQMGCQYLRSSDLLGGLDPGYPIVGCAGSCDGDYLFAAGDKHLCSPGGLRGGRVPAHQQPCGFESTVRADWLARRSL